MTGIDQTVISRLENGKQYGLRWSRFAILVARLHGLEAETAKAPRPWWVAMGITPPIYFRESLIQQGLLPPEPSVHDEADADEDDQEAG